MVILGDTIRLYLEQGYTSFHTPGHKGRKEFFEALNFPEFDLTELPGLDMLHSPNGVIARAQQEAARIYGSEESFFLINGGTSGNHAMLMSLLGNSNRFVRVTRDAHRSVMAAFIQSGLIPDYVPALIHPDFNLPLGLDVEMFTRERFGVGAWHLTCPTYYGTLANIEGVMESRNNHYPEVPVLIDQAHGAHYMNSFSLFPPSAVGLGADLVLHSVHKTLSSLTQTALLHVQGSLIHRARLKQALEMLQSSSPSYIFLTSLEKALQIALEGKERWERLYEATKELHHKLGDSYRILTDRDEETYGIWKVDWTKILVNTRPLGITASACVEHLRQKYRIEPELWDEENILLLLGIGNEPEDIKLLEQGLTSCLRLIPEGKKDRLDERGLRVHNMPIPPLCLSPREAFIAPKQQIPLQEAKGRISGETISPYPPGIPLVVMGEEITPEVLDLLMHKEGFRFQGWEGSEYGMIWVVEEGKVR